MTIDPANSPTPLAAQVRSVSTYSLMYHNSTSRTQTLVVMLSTTLTIIGQYLQMQLLKIYPNKKLIVYEMQESTINFMIEPWPLLYEDSFHRIGSNIFC